MLDLHSPRQNHLLAALPEVEYNRLLPLLELVELSAGEVLDEPMNNLKYAYFPTDSIISVLYVLANGQTSEIAVIGNEGVLGIDLFMGGNTMQNQAVVQSTGWSYRMCASLIRQEFGHNGTLPRLILLYTQTLIAQMSQTAVCNRHHNLEQQLCRRLLLSLDRLPDSQLTMTQELIANMLGVRREGITILAGKLQRAGLIEYHRGHIVVLNRAGLEARCCECYQVVKTESDRLLPPVPQRVPLTVDMRYSS